jgi:effector-binding domain-containing protein
VSSLLKKIIIIVSVVTFILFVSLLVAAWYMGMFAPVSVKEAERGPYYTILLSHDGAHREISQKINEVSGWLADNHLNHSAACRIFYENLIKIDSYDVHSEVGYLIDDSLQVPPPLYCLKIPARSTIVASIKANSAIAWFKTYPALINWMEKYNFKQDTLKPIIELYRNDGVVDVELALLKSH